MIEEKLLKDLLQTFTYRPGWKFFVLDGAIHVQAMVIDTDDHERMTPLRFVRPLPQFTRDDFDWTRWLLYIVLEVEDHEAREFFKIDGVKVFDPHG